MYSIVMLNFNSIALNVGCVNSIFKNTKDFELIIVDNNSTDGTKGYLEELELKHENVKTILNEKNNLFAKGNNQGVELATGEYVILLSNDIIVSAPWCRDW